MAGFFSRIWAMLLASLCVPIYLNLLGIEAYGLIGVFASLMAMVGVLDLGLGIALNRELARLSGLPGRLRDQRNTVRTLEIIYWAIAGSAGGAVILLAPAIAHHWIHARNLPPTAVEHAVRVMGFIIALQFPFGLYQGGLLGLQRQVSLNAILVAAGTLQSVGAVLILWKISATVGAFFTWQLVVCTIQTMAAAFVLWRSLRSEGHPPRFQASVVRDIRVFALGISANSLVGLALTQLDKALLSGLLPLSELGYYSFAGTIAAIMWMAIVPVNQTFFPRFAQLLARNDESALSELYHRTCQFMAVVLVPSGLTIALFARDVIAIWTRDPVTAARSAGPAAILIAGTMLNGLSSVPAFMQAAAGWPQLALYTNAGSALVLVPAMLLVVPRYGPSGAALVLLTLNCVYMLVTVPLMHRRLLRGELRRWITGDVLRPAAAAAAVVGICRVWSPEANDGAMVLYLGLTWVLASAAAVLLAPHVRSAVVGLFRNARPVAWNRV